MYPFVLEVARRGDEGHSGLFGSGRGRVCSDKERTHLHLFLNKKYINGQNISVNKEEFLPRRRSIR